MHPGADPSKTLRALDAAIEAAGKLARRRVDALRRANPQLSDAQLRRKVDVAFTSAMTSTGAATGGSAAAPGVGTGAAIAMTAADASWFLTAASTYVLATAELRGVRIENFEHQRALVLLVLTGGGGSTFFGKAAQRTGGISAGS